MERAIIRGSDVSQQLSHGILVNPGTKIAETSPSAQKFQILHERAERDTTADYSMVSRTDKYSESEHDQRYNAQESSKERK